MTRADDGVIVVGAGPVGLVTALKLARAGVRVTVVDAEPEIIRSPRAIVYHAPTVEALDALGVLGDMKAVGIVKQDYQFRTLDGTVLAAPHMSVLEPADTAYPFNLHLAQHDLAAIVLKHLLRMPQAVVRWNSRFVALTQDRDAVEAVVETAHGTQSLRGAFLVGADGGRSAVRQALNLGFAGTTWTKRLIATNLHYDFEAHGFARANFVIDPVHWAVIVRINNDGLWRVTYGEDLDTPEDDFRARIPGHYAHLLPGREPYRLEAAAPFRVHERAAETFRRGRALLAGDAAHVCNPMGGLGLTSGLLDAVALADALAAVIREAAPDAVLDRYAAERRRIFLALTAPRAAENLRRMSEADPDRRRTDAEGLRRLHDPAFAREALMFTYKLRSSPLASAAASRQG